MNKPHPFTQALNAVAAMVVPSFEVVSVRDNQDSNACPRLDYVIINSTNEVYDPVEKKFKGRLNVFLDLFLHEPKNNFEWCGVPELEQNQDRQALMHDMETKLRQILLLIQNPQYAMPSLRVSQDDANWTCSNFTSLQISTMRQVAKLPPHSYTGASCQASFEYTTEGITCCVLNSGDIEDLTAYKEAYREGSTSYQIIENAINGL